MEFMSVVDKYFIFFINSDIPMFVKISAKQSEVCNNVHC